MFRSRGTLTQFVLQAGFQAMKPSTAARAGYAIIVRSHAGLIAETRGGEEVSARSDKNERDRRTGRPRKKSTCCPGKIRFTSFPSLSSK
ncbi:hypothetical protein PUN28_010700 [Cardiocondyla obscurior]|uniref:Uncharacterized protein n=1 Tax=Cardiocondyla obscurior TaxID=286306 RepID=A0AAW2FJB8_9HYME